MIEKGCNFIYPDEYESLDNEFLSEDLYAKFNERILYRIKSPNPGSYRFKKPNGLLIFGPSGNGKSILVRQFAQLTKLPYIVFNGLDIFEDNIHNSKGGFNIVMKMAHKNSPCVVIVENVETIVPKQTKTTTRFERLEVISNLSLIQNSGENDVFVFATTSRPNEIDAQFAMSGYINELFYASYPDFSMRLRIIGHFLEKIVYNKDDVLCNYIAKESDGFTISDIISLVDDVALKVYFTGSELSLDLIKQVINSFHLPTNILSKKNYDEINNLLTSKPVNKIIGFHR